MTPSKRAAAKADVIAHVLSELAARAGHDDLVSELAERLDAIEATGAVDGRATSWTKERRAATGERIRKMWQEKRREGTFYAYRWADVEPTAVGDRAELAAHLNLTPRSLGNMLANSPDGLLIRRGSRWVVYAQNPDARDRLLNAKAVATGDPDQIITLPAKFGGRF